MFNILKQIYYFLLDILTLKKGIKVLINNFPITLPARYYKYFPARYEEENFSFFKKKCKTNMTILDVGAHFGLYSVYMQKLSGGKVYSFEPTPTTITILKKTLELNNVKNNVEVVEAAAAGQTGKAVFFVDEFPGSVSNSLVQYGDRNVTGYQVDIIALDEFVQSKNIKVDFIKIDAEGAELSVLKGAVNILETQRPIIILAMHPSAIAARNESNLMVWNFLKDKCYQIVYQGKNISQEKFCNKQDLFDVHLIPIG
ncbi:MAG: FkbM family methyltransferase [Bacteroidota bacterium]|nr:FkbM family methyltransferase [Bacteroidota bacterium]